VKLRAFERLATAEWAAIPAEFREGAEGPVVVRRSHRHPLVPGYYTLGMCVPAPPLFSAGGELHLSTVLLYYGSFVACERRDPDFDIAAEVRETLRHEVRHHIEDRAGSAALREEDAAEEAAERWREGLPHPPGFWRFGAPEGRGRWRLGPDLFVEMPLDRATRERLRRGPVAIVLDGEERALEPADLAAPGGLVVFEGAAPPPHGDGGHGHSHGPSRGGAPGDLVIVLPAGE
jgi:hypothetical protein